MYPVAFDVGWVSQVFNPGHRIRVEITSSWFTQYDRNTNSGADNFFTDATVVVANQEVATIRNAARMTAALEQRYGKERVNVVISRYDPRAEIGQADVERVIGRPVTSLFPNNYETALASLNNGRPLVLDNHTKLASALTTFASPALTRTFSAAAIAPRSCGQAAR